MSVGSKIREIMTEILEINGEITDGFGPKDSQNWDSINNLRMITAIEEAFGIQFTMEDIKSMVSFKKIEEVEKFLE